MTQETAVETPAESILQTPTAPVVETIPDSPPAAPPEDAPAPTDEGADEPSEADPEAAFLALVDAEDAPHRDVYQKRIQESHEKGWADAEDFHGPRYQQLEESQKAITGQLAAFDQTIGRVNGRIQKALEEGATTEDAIVQAFQAHPNVLQAMQAVGETKQAAARNEGYQQGAWNAGVGTTIDLYGALFKSAGKPSLMAQFTQKIQKAQSGAEHKAILDEVLEAVDKAYASKYLPLGRKGGAEEAKTQQRAGQRPTQTAGTPNKTSNDSQKRLDRLAYGKDSDGNQASDEDKAWLAARQ